MNKISKQQQQEQKPQVISFTNELSIISERASAHNQNAPVGWCLYMFIRTRVRLLMNSSEMLEEQTEALISEPLLLLCLPHRNRLNQEDRTLHFRAATFHVVSSAVLENECCSGASQIDLISLVSSNTGSLFFSLLLACNSIFLVRSPQETSQRFEYRE